MVLIAGFFREPTVRRFPVCDSAVEQADIQHLRGRDSDPNNQPGGTVKHKEARLEQQQVSGQEERHLCPFSTGHNIFLSSRASDSPRVTCIFLKSVVHTRRNTPTPDSWSMGEHD